MKISNSLSNIKKTYIYAAALALFLGALYVSVHYLVNKKLAELQTTIVSQISDQEKVLTTVSEATARNGVDDASKLIIRDCNIDERTQFDTLLGSLDEGLANTDLAKLDRLFGRCGNFYAVQKAIMVARLAKEVETYKNSVEQLRTVADKKVTAKYPVEGWSALADEEKKQSILFTKMVQQQDAIIKTLLAGKPADSEEIKVILAEVKETQQSLFVANRQAADLRATLVSQ